MFTLRSFGKVGVEAYAAYALRAWLARDQPVSDRTRRFAKWSAICSFALGMAGQVAYHLMAQAGMARAPWAITAVVSCLPVLVLGMGTALAHMLRADAEAVYAPGSRTGPPAVPRSLSWSPQDQAGSGRIRPQKAGGRPGPVREPGPGWSCAGITTRPRDHGAWPAARAGTGGAGPDCRLQAGRSRTTGVAASVVQRRHHGLERRAERSGTHDQCRAGRCDAVGDDRRGWEAGQRDLTLVTGRGTWPDQAVWKLWRWP